MVTGALPIFGRSADGGDDHLRLSVGRRRHQVRAGRLKGANRLRLRILVDMEVILGQVGDQIALLVRHHDVERHQADVDLDVRRWRLLRPH